VCTSAVVATHAPISGISARRFESSIARASRVAGVARSSSLS
jgi:hypothetical protein